MGISTPIVEALIREHAYRPLRGDALFIGRQTIYYTAPAILDLFQQCGIKPGIDPSDIETDVSTQIRAKGFENEKLITDASLMNLFGVKNVMALDHSRWENADLVHDLRYPVPITLCNSADILIDGSTLDNVFTPSTVLENFTRLLRPGGRMFLHNAYSSFETAYAIMPPMWYVDYFVMNGFADCRVYVLLYSDQRRNAFYVSLDDVQRLGIGMGFFPNTLLASTIVFAEKGEGTTSDRFPVQQHYRSAEDWQVYNGNLSAMLKSERPHLVRSNIQPFVPTVQGGFHFINGDFMADDAAFTQPQAPEAAQTARVRTLLSRLRSRLIG